MSNEPRTSIAGDRIPLAIRSILIGAHIFVALRQAFSYNNLDQELEIAGLVTLYVLLLMLLSRLVLVPSVFVFFGALLKLVDPSFRLENAYYLGVFLAFVLNTRGLVAPMLGPLAN